jgi:muconate cycloisomerase
MRIESADVILTRIPTRRPHRMTSGTSQFQESVYVRLRTADGLFGWGEAPHMIGDSHAGETQASVALQLRDRLLPAVLGGDPRGVEPAQAAMDKALRENPRAKSAVNIALFDLAGKALGVPVSTLLGGSVRTTVALSWSLPMMSTEAMLAEADEMIGRGFGILKLKVGARDSVAEDVAVAAAVREHVGDTIRLRADANQGYSVAAATRVARGLEALGFEFLEQPVGRFDLAGMADVSRSSGLEIMADESANNAREVYEVARARAASMISIYINSGGGISEAVRMAHVAEAAGLRGYFGGALEGPVAARACLHVAAACPSVSLGCEQVGQYLLESDIGTEPIPFVDGEFVVPDAPGLGVDIDPERLARYEIDRFEVTASR